jgi:hypothetical protein
LAAHLYALRTGVTSLSAEAKAAGDYETMWNLVKKYTETLEQHTASENAKPPTHQTIVLTGATGALGSHILAQLAVQPSVAKIYALVRAKDDAIAVNRVKESLSQRRIKIDSNVFDEKVVPLSSNIDEDRLGLRHEIYAEICADVTAVIAVSWPCT